MFWTWSEPRNDFITFDKTLELVPLSIVAAAAKAVSEIIRVQILDRGLAGSIHNAIILKPGVGGPAAC